MWNLMKVIHNKWVPSLFHHVAFESVMDSEKSTDLESKYLGSNSTDLVLAVLMYNFGWVI